MTDPIQIPNLIQPAGPAKAAAFAEGGKSVPGATGKDFKTILLDSLEEVNRLQVEADQGVQRWLTGETDNLAEVLTAVNKSGVAFDLLMQIRNKLADAYREIQQMRV
jgi:flagellar hook-basal body complex protein FliE